MATEPEGIGPGRPEGAAVREGESARTAIRDAEEQLREKTREARSRVNDRTRELRAQAEEKAERWSGTLGEHAERVARALRAAGDALDDEGEGRLSSISQSAAEQVERMSGYLRDENPSAMLNDLEQTARRNPGAFLATTFIAGLVVGRFFRASEPSAREGDEGGGRGWARESGRAHEPFRYEPPSESFARRESEPVLEEEGLMVGGPEGLDDDEDWPTPVRRVGTGWEGDL